MLWVGLLFWVCVGLLFLLVGVGLVWLGLMFVVCVLALCGVCSFVLCLLLGVVCLDECCLFCFGLYWF